MNSYHDTVMCYVNIHEIPTKTLREVTKQSKTTSRQNCIRLLEDDNIFHLTTQVDVRDSMKINSLWQKYKEFKTVQTRIHDSMNDRTIDIEKSITKTRIPVNQYKKYTKSLRSLPNVNKVRKPYLKLSDMSSSNMYVNEFNIGTELSLNGKPILNVINETNQNIEHIQDMISSNQEQVDSVNNQVSYYESTVQNNMYYMLNPSENINVIDLIQPTTFEYTPIIFQRTYIEDNSVTFSMRIVYQFEQPTIPPKIFRVKLPYVALQIDHVYNVKSYIPIRGLIKYRINNKDYVSNPSQSFINLKESDDYLFFQHTVQTFLNSIEFYIIARYTTNIESMNISYITPMRYDVKNSQIITSSFVQLLDKFHLHSGYMQWNSLKDRIELSLQITLLYRPENSNVHDDIQNDKTFTVRLPIPADVYYRNVKPYGYGAISINDRFTIERPIVGILDANELTIDMSSVSSVFLLTEASSLEIFVNIVYFTYTSRHVRQPMILTTNVTSTYDTIQLSNITLSNAYEYSNNNQHLLNNQDLFVHVQTDNTLTQTRSILEKPTKRLQTWVPIQELTFDVQVVHRNIHITNINYFDCMCIQSGIKKQTTNHKFDFITNSIVKHPVHDIQLTRLEKPVVHMKLNDIHYTSSRIAFTCKDILQNNIQMSHDKHVIRKMKIIKYKLYNYKKV